MTVQKRIQIIRLLELIDSQKQFCDDCGLFNASLFNGERVNDIPDDGNVLAPRGTEATQEGR